MKEWIKACALETTFIKYKVVNSRWVVGCIPLQFSITINYTQHMTQIIQ